MGGSAPHLRSLHLNGIPYPSIVKLLSSTTNLVRLSLCRIPHSGYVSPKTIVPSPSTLSRLGSFALGLGYHRFPPHRASRHLPPLTCVVFPNLTSLDFGGDIEYLEDILCQIETLRSTKVVCVSSINWYSTLHYLGTLSVARKYP